MTARIIDQPQPGYWMVRLVKHGPETPACIQWEQTEFEPDAIENAMDRSPILTARIAGEIVALDEVWLRKGREITADEYHYQLADLDWHRQYDAAHPKANPRRAVRAHDIGRLF